MTTTSLLSGLKLYVGTYAKYNNGSIAGEWLELDDYSSKDEFLEACAELHNDEQDPEFMYQDHENIPENLYSEAGVFDFWSLAEELESADISDFELYAEYCNHFGYELSEGIDAYTDAYAGDYSSENDPQGSFAYDTVQELLPHDAPDFLTRYFDYDAFERDLFMTDYTEISGHIFRNV
jgi:antirestriction protein